jgi:hypothetical protein
MKVMYEIFGEFDSAEEINQKAAGLLAEGKEEDIKKLAKENGLDPEFVQAYITGDIPVITDSMQAAVGKIELERSGITDPLFSGSKEDMINYLLTACQDEEFAKKVRSKGKNLKNCFEYCNKKISERLHHQAGSLRDRDVYAMEKDYYLM